MKVPGDNLLKKAFNVISKDTFIYRQFKSRTTNDIGIDVPAFENDIPLKGSIQAIPRRLYQQHGLDWKKKYITIYSSDSIEGVDRDTSGDRVVFNGKLYQVLDENEWTPIDGWNGVICVQVS